METETESLKKKFKNFGPQEQNILASLKMFHKDLTKRFDKKIEIENNDQDLINIYSPKTKKIQFPNEIKPDLLKSDIYPNNNLMENSEILIYQDKENDLDNEFEPMKKVPTSNSLHSEEEERINCYEIEQIIERKISPNNTNLLINRSERLKSIDERDESKEEDASSKHSREPTKGSIFILNEEELKIKENFEINQYKENNEINLIEEKKEITKNEILLNKNNSIQPYNQPKIVKVTPKFEFLDIADFKRKKSCDDKSAISMYLFYKNLFII